MSRYICKNRIYIISNFIRKLSTLSFCHRVTDWKSKRWRYERRVTQSLLKATSERGLKTCPALLSGDLFYHNYLEMFHAKKNPRGKLKPQITLQIRKLYLLFSVIPTLFFLFKKDFEPGVLDGSTGLMNLAGRLCIL